MNVELTRYRILPGKSSRVDEWLRMLNDRMPETLATLEREEMYFEVIFRERVGDEEFLAWFSVQGEGGEHIETSPHEIDRLHLGFARECLDLQYGAVDALPQVVMVPDRVASALGWGDPAGWGVEWTGEVTWREARTGAAKMSEDSEHT